MLLSFRSRGSSDGGSDCLLSQLHGRVAAGYIKWMQSFLYVRTAISTTISASRLKETEIESSSLLAGIRFSGTGRRPIAGPCTCVDGDGL